MCPERTLLPLAQTILAAEGEAISEEKFLQVLSADYAYIKGLSYRQTSQRLEDLVGLHRMRNIGNKPAAEAKLSRNTTNPRSNSPRNSYDDELNAPIAFQP